MVFGHHPLAEEEPRLQGPAGCSRRPRTAPSSERVWLPSCAAAGPLSGYFAGHTHRNKVRHLPTTGAFPWVEVACVKDFPGSWAEYRVFEGGILQIHRRIHCDPTALAWSERCRSLYGGLYPLYAWGAVEDRCFEIGLRESAL